MSEPRIRVNIAEWINRVKAADEVYTRRVITEIILHGIATTPFLSQRLYLKGEVLMGLVYGSPRQTVDIDFSTSPEYRPNHQTSSELRKYLDNALHQTTAVLGYADIVLKVQSIKEHPHNRYPNARFPALTVKVGCATRDTLQEKQLTRGQASTVVGLNFTFKEKTSSVQFLEIGRWS